MAHWSSDVVRNCRAFPVNERPDSGGRGQAFAWLVRHASLVCKVLTRASATRSAETAESRLACVGAGLAQGGAVIALLRVGERGHVLIEVGALQIIVHGQYVTEMPLAEHNNMIKVLPSDGIGRAAR
jgi:hypothetical protein